MWWEKQNDLPPTGLLPKQQQQLDLGYVKPGAMELLLVLPCRVSHVGPNHLDHLLLLPDSWTRNRADGTQTGTHMDVITTVNDSPC